MYIFFSLVDIIPPSPRVEIILSLQNDQVATFPNDPTILLFILAPWACAQSSIIFNLYFFEILNIFFILHGLPDKWTQIIAFVFTEIFFSISSTNIFWSVKFTSINFGIWPALTIAEAEEKKLLAVTIISDFIGNIKDLIANSNATVPFAKATEYFLLIQLENNFSNFFPIFPLT